MGLVKFGGGIVGISGSIGGTVFARNRYGNYARSRTKPTNPATARQSKIRQAVADLTNAWSTTLSDAQRTAWGLYAASVSMLNRLGEPMNLSGFNHFVRSNAPLLQNDLPIVEDGPTTFELPEQDPTFAVGISEATQLLSITFDDTKAWCDLDDAFLFVYMGTPQNPQRNFFGGPWRLAGAIAGDSGTPPTSPTTIACPFAATEGQRVWVQARLALPDGRLSEPMRADGFCAA